MFLTDCVYDCVPLFAVVFVCASMRLLYGHLLLWTAFARVHIYIRECVRFHATGLCGLVLLAIDRAAQLRLLMG